MAWEDTLTTIGIGAVGGALVLAIEHLFLHFKEKRTLHSQRVVRFPNPERMIDENIFHSLKHGASIELMKSVLGTPDKHYDHDEPVFTTSKFDDPDEREIDENYEEGLGKKTHSYIYKFKNADIKITSRDNTTIDSLTVIANESLPFGYVLFPWNEDENNSFNVTRVTKKMVEDCRPEFFQTRWDNVFVLSLYAGSPTYDFYTYFGYADYEKGVELTKENPDSFINGIISGVCISKNDTDVYYIGFQDTL